jgi:hypothetical protein
MTNEQANVNIATTQLILMALLTVLVGENAAAELLSGVVTTAPAAGLALAHKSVKDTYDASPTTFVDTQQNIDDLDDVVDAIVATEIIDFASVSGEAYDALQAASPEV